MPTRRQAPAAGWHGTLPVAVADARVRHLEGTAAIAHGVRVKDQARTGCADIARNEAIPRQRRTWLGIAASLHSSR